MVSAFFSCLKGFILKAVHPAWEVGLVEGEGSIARVGYNIVEKVKLTLGS